MAGSEDRKGMNPEGVVAKLAEFYMKDESVENLAGLHIEILDEEIEEAVEELKTKRKVMRDEFHEETISGENFDMEYIRSIDPEKRHQIARELTDYTKEAQELEKQIVEKVEEEIEDGDFWGFAGYESEGLQEVLGSGYQAIEEELEKAYESGDLSQGEYESIRERLEESKQETFNEVNRVLEGGGQQPISFSEEGPADRGEDYDPSLYDEDGEDGENGEENGDDEEDEDEDGGVSRRKLIGGAALLFGGGWAANELFGGGAAPAPAPGNETTTTTETPVYATTTSTVETPTTTPTTTTTAPTTTVGEPEGTLGYDEFRDEWKELSEKEKRELFNGADNYAQFMDGDVSNQEVHEVHVIYDPEGGPENSRIEYVLEDEETYIESDRFNIPDELAKELLDYER